MPSCKYSGYVVFVHGDGTVFVNDFPLHETVEEAVRAMLAIIDGERSLDFDIRSGRGKNDPETEQRYETMREDARNLRPVELGEGRILQAVPVTKANTINKEPS